MMYFKKHWHYYFFVFVIQLLGFFLVLSAKGNTQLQMAFVVLAASMYVLWGIVHHLIHHDLHAKIVIEYVLMGALGIAIIFFILQ